MSDDGGYRCAISNKAGPGKSLSDLNLRVWGECYFISSCGKVVTPIILAPNHVSVNVLVPFSVNALKICNFFSTLFVIDLLFRLRSRLVMVLLFYFQFHTPVKLKKQLLVKFLLLVYLENNSCVMQINVVIQRN